MGMLDCLSKCRVRSVLIDAGYNHRLDMMTQQGIDSALFLVGRIADVEHHDLEASRHHEFMDDRQILDEDPIGQRGHHHPDNPRLG